jgi:hypothetical protein
VIYLNKYENWLMREYALSMKFSDLLIRFLIVCSKKCLTRRYSLEFYSYFKRLNTKFVKMIKFLLLHKRIPIQWYLSLFKNFYFIREKLMIMRMSKRLEMLKNLEIMSIRLYLGSNSKFLAFGSCWLNS